jgi:hypothetical protein
MPSATMQLRSRLAGAGQQQKRYRANGLGVAAAAEDDGGVVVCVANHRRSELPFTNRHNNVGAYGTAARLYVSTPMPLCDRRHHFGRCDVWPGMRRRITA